jgi:hypothetical protein
MTPIEKTEWSKFTIRIPRLWALRIQEIGSLSGNSEAQIMRELVQIGLPVIARQTEERIAWVRGKIDPKRSADGKPPSVTASARVQGTRKPVRPAPASARRS